LGCDEFLVDDDPLLLMYSGLLEYVLDGGVEYELVEVREICGCLVDGLDLVLEAVRGGGVSGICRVLLVTSTFPQFFEVVPDVVD
jgi:hypothetical protein